ncbi:7TM domain-containing protein, partial [Pseudomonas viridiflava]|uniref:7TM domain-containing protein n=1 Tax=Pseudomonas viridiflava TaxID=33069 RepID=UPI0024067D9E
LSRNSNEDSITITCSICVTSTISPNNREKAAPQLAKLADASAEKSFLSYSLYGLPLETQKTFMIMIVIPVGVLVILLLRNLIGLQTLGTFTPVL